MSQKSWTKRKTKMKESTKAWDVYQVQEWSRRKKSGESYEKLSSQFGLVSSSIKRAVYRFERELPAAEKLLEASDRRKRRWMASAVRTCQSESLSSQEIRRRFGLSPRMYRLWSMATCVLPMQPQERSQEKGEVMLENKRKPRPDKYTDEKDRRIAELEWECYLKDVKIEFIKKKIELRERLASERSKSGKQK